MLRHHRSIFLVALSAIAVPTAPLESQASPRDELQLDPWPETKVFMTLHPLRKHRLSSVGTALKRRPAPILAGDDLVFATTKGVVSFSLRRGKRAWWKPSVALLGSCGSNERVLVAKGKQLLCVDAADGHILWQVGNPLGPIESVAMAEDRLILASSGGRLATLHAADGRVVWAMSPVDRMVEKKSRPGLGRRPPWCEFASHRFDRSQSPVLACGETVLLGTANGVIRAYALSDGKSVWTQQLEGPANGPAVSDGKTAFWGTLCRVAAFTCGNGDPQGVLKIDGDAVTLLWHEGMIYGHTDRVQTFALAPSAWPALEWSYRGGRGRCDNEEYECFSIDRGVFWKAKSGPFVEWGFAGFQLSAPATMYVVEYEKPQAPLAMLNISEGGPEWNRFIKNPLRSWEDRWVLVDGRSIVILSESEGKGYPHE